LAAVIRNCVRAQQEAAWVAPMMVGTPPLSRSEFFVLNTTGPGLLSRTLIEHPSTARDVTVLFPRDVCDTRCWNAFGDMGIHLMNGSWRANKNFVVRRLAQYIEVAQMRTLLTQSRRLGRSRSVDSLPHST
jgi:hypothetical protein